MRLQSTKLRRNILHFHVTSEEKRKENEKNKREGKKKPSNIRVLGIISCVPVSDRERPFLYVQTTLKESSHNT